VKTIFPEGEGDNAMTGLNEQSALKRPGYAYVPFQRMDKVYPPNRAMKAGTIFPELNITLDEYERGLFNGK